MSLGFEVVPMRADQWRELRALRLEMLADTPIAFGDTVASALAMTDADWQARAAQNAGPGQPSLVAIERAGASDRWIGMMRCFIEAGSGRPFLATVYVAPAHRGRANGVADALLDGIEAWVMSQGMPELFLQVHEDNPPASAFYLRRGFRFTGQAEPDPRDPARQELEMSRRLPTAELRHGDIPSGQCMGGLGSPAMAIPPSGPSTPGAAHASRIEVIPMREPDWERLRDLRLEMLADTPKAYVESLAAAQVLDEGEWRFRARRAGEPGSFGAVARDRELDVFVGTMSAFIEPTAGRAWLVAVYVAPGYRGRASEAADRLLDQVESWAAGQGKGQLFLHVHEENARAIAFYLRRGYAFTGNELPYDLDPAERELEMTRSL